MFKFILNLLFFWRKKPQLKELSTSPALPEETLNLIQSLALATDDGLLIRKENQKKAAELVEVIASKAYAEILKDLPEVVRNASAKGNERISLFNINSVKEYKEYIDNFTGRGDTVDLTDYMDTNVNYDICLAIVDKIDKLGLDALAERNYAYEYKVIITYNNLKKIINSLKEKEPLTPYRD